MPLPTLTPANVATKLADLYALPKSSVLIEADAIEANFRQWMRDNFSLTTDQGTHLTGMNNDAVKYYGQQCAICFRNLLNITLVYPAPPAPGIGKWDGEKNDIEVKTNGLGALEVTGSVTFTMEYRV